MAKGSEWFSKRSRATAYTKLKSGKERKSKYGWQIVKMDMGVFGGKQYKAVPRSKPIARRN